MEVEIINTITLGYASVSMRSDGIVHTHIYLKEAVSLEQAKELVDAYLKVTESKKTPHLFTANKFVILEKEVMDFMKNVANDYGKADAMVISSLPQKITGNFYLKFIKPKVPTKFFSKKEKAVLWLKQFLD